jgi:hypothetical protein
MNDGNYVRQTMVIVKGYTGYTGTGYTGMQ